MSRSYLKDKLFGFECTVFNTYYGGRDSQYLKIKKVLLKKTPQNTKGTISSYDYKNVLILKTNKMGYTFVIIIIYTFKQFYFSTY